MTPDDVAERLTRWQGREGLHMEPDGRTWTLWQDGTQVGHVRMREERHVRESMGLPPMRWSAWTVETSRGIAREAIGLDKTDTPV